MMYCKHCGSGIAAGASFCSNCGKRVDSNTDYTTSGGYTYSAGGYTYADQSATGSNGYTYADQGAANGYTYANTGYQYGGVEQVQFPEALVNEERESKSGRLLAFSILALAFSLSFYLAPIGLAFMIVARCLLSGYVRDYGETTGRASVAKGFSTAAIPVSIVMNVLLTIVIAAALTLI